jgi:N utilization substance protein B
MLSIKPKTLSRIAAVQSIYCNYATNSDIKEVVQDIKTFYANEKIYQDDKLIEIKIHHNHLSELALETIAHKVEIDKFIEENLAPNWTMSKLHLTLLSILRVGIAELIYFPQTPFKVAISEFTDIANNMLAENEVAFVNSLLNKVHDTNKQNLLKHDPFI